jgi:hypothetical protein
VSFLELFFSQFSVENCNDFLKEKPKKYNQKNNSKLKRGNRSKMNNFKIGDEVKLTEEMSKKDVFKNFVGKIGKIFSIHNYHDWPISVKFVDDICSFTPNELEFAYSELANNRNNNSPEK